MVLRFLRVNDKFVGGILSCENAKHVIPVALVSHCCF